MEAGRFVGTGETFTLPSDMVFKAIGQVFVADPIDPDGRRALEMRDGRIVVDDEGRTSVPNIWAGGDCVAGGQDLTVEAVQHGKRAALSIDRALKNPV
jgi:glutamate synthase (NADPH/NADH) small chain